MSKEGRLVVLYPGGEISKVAIKPAKRPLDIKTAKIGFWDNARENVIDILENLRDSLQKKGVNVLPIVSKRSNFEGEDQHQKHWDFERGTAEEIYGKMRELGADAVVMGCGV